VWDTVGAISKKVSRNSLLSGTTADFHLGLADAAAPIAQTLSVQSVVAGTTNTAGVNFSINGSQGTGTGAGGSLLFRTAPAGSSGTTQNALGTALAITAAGNVGIGTTAPATKLDIVASAAFDGIKITNSHASSAAFLSLVNNTGNDASFGCYSSGISDGFANNAGFGAKNSVIINCDGGSFSGGTNSIQFRAGGYAASQERMRITHTGNVGIGTTAPTQKLDVAGAVSAGSSTNGYQLTNGTTRVSAWGNNQGSNGGLGLSSTFMVGWSSAVDGGNFGLLDTILFRDGIGQLALRNGAAAQTFRVYNTFPGNGNNEFGSLNWVDQANEFQIATGQAGTGTSRALCLRGQGGLNIRIGSAPGTLVWQVGMTTGHLLAGASNTYDIGSSSVLVRVGYFNFVQAATYLQTGAGNVQMAGPSSGVLTLLNGAGSDFNRIQFGGTTASFPAIKRSSTTLQARLADDSAFAPIQGKLTTDTAFTSGAITDTGYIVLYDSAGTAYKVACTPV